MTRNLTRATLLLLVVAGSATLVACNSGDSSPTGPSEPALDVAPPAVPAQLTPAPFTQFSHYPRNTTLAWSSVLDPSGPVSYRVEVQWCGGTVYNPTNCQPRSNWCPGALSSTTCNFDFVGAQPGRWRVRAVDNAGNQSAFSDWSTFAYSL